MRNMLRTLVLVAVASLVGSPVSGTVYVLPVDQQVNLDGNATNDIRYFLCGPTCPAIGPGNGTGWASGNNTGLSASAWTQQSFAHASAQT